MHGLTLGHVSKTFTSGQVALRDVSLHVPTGETLVLIGPSGAGKSTLLRVIAGLEAADQGQSVIRWDDQRLDRLPPHQRNVALLSQRPMLYPQQTVRANLGFGISRDDRLRIPAIADQLALTGLLDRYPNQLSGGEIQRVALGRMLIRRARLWLLDEPTSFLDPILRRRFHEQIRLLQAQNGVTIIHVTHEIAETMDHPTRMGVLVQGELIQWDQPARIAARPEHWFAAEALATAWPGGVWNRFSGRFIANENGSMRFQPDDSGIAWKCANDRLGLPTNDRPMIIGWSQSVRFGTPLEVPATEEWELGDWTVTAVESADVHATNETIVHLEQAGRRLQTRVLTQQLPRIRAVLPCRVSPDAVSYYDHASGRRLEVRIA